MTPPTVDPNQPSPRKYRSHGLREVLAVRFDDETRASLAGGIDRQISEAYECQRVANSSLDLIVGAVLVDIGYGHDVLLQELLDDAEREPAQVIAGWPVRRVGWELRQALLGHVRRFERQLERISEPPAEPSPADAAADLRDVLFGLFDTSSCSTRARLAQLLERGDLFEVGDRERVLQQVADEVESLAQVLASVATAPTSVPFPRGAAKLSTTVAGLQRVGEELRRMGG